MARLVFMGDPASLEPAGVEARPRRSAKAPRERICNAAFGTTQHTPDQSYFRRTAEGRMPADFSTGAHAPLHQMTIHPDGTLDTSRLEPDITGYIDLGGHGARDVAARRP